MYLGLDTHDQYSQVAVVDDDGNLLQEHRVPNDHLDDLAQEYAGAEAAIEASGHHRHVFDTLDQHLDVTVVNPAKNRLIADASVKTDRVDAKRLALLLRADMLAESHVPPDEIRALRNLVRTRKALVDERTAEKNRVRAVLKRTDNTYDKELFGPTGREFLRELSLSRADRTIVEAHLSVIEEYDAQIAAVEELIEGYVLESTAAQLLLSIPGVGTNMAAVIVAEVGEIERFDEDAEVVSYAGLDPTVKQSGETERRGGISKEGPAALRWALVQSAWGAVRSGDEYLGRYYRRLNKRKCSQKAIVATARKLLVSIYHMLKREEEYDPPGVSG